MNTVRFARTKTVFTVEQRRRSALDMLCLSLFSIQTKQPTVYCYNRNIMSYYVILITTNHQTNNQSSMCNLNLIKPQIAHLSQQV